VVVLQGKLGKGLNIEDKDLMFEVILEMGRILLECWRLLKLL
jgi:hypothetical protein